jgi:hypothetical protein
MQQHKIKDLLKDKPALIQRIDAGIMRELQRQKSAGKEFLSDQEIDDIVDSVIKEELGDSWKEKY